MYVTIEVPAWQEASLRGLLVGLEHPDFQMLSFLRQLADRITRQSVAVDHLEMCFGCFWDLWGFDTKLGTWNRQPWSSPLWPRGFCISVAFAAILDQSQLAKPGRPPFACPLATDAILMMEVGGYSSHPFCFFWSRIFHFVISAECDAGCWQQFRCGSKVHLYDFIWQRIVADFSARGKDI